MTTTACAFKRSQRIFLIGAASTAQPARFFSLPPELRNRIYMLAFEHKDHENSLNDFKHNEDSSPRPTFLGAEWQDDADDALLPSVLSVLATCKQIYHEACQIFYGKYYIGFTSAQSLLSFVLNTTAKRLAGVQQLMVQVESMTEVMKAVQYMKFLPNAKKMEVHGVQFTAVNGEDEVKGFMDGVLGLAGVLKQEAIRAANGLEMRRIVLDATMCYGEVSEEERERFENVLLGMSGAGVVWSYYRSTFT